MVPPMNPIDNILSDFRSNGRDTSLDSHLDAINIDQYTPSAKRLFLRLFGGVSSSLDEEVKVIRPPSKTPAHLPTSSNNLTKQRLYTAQTPAYPSWSPPAMAQMWSPQRYILVNTDATYLPVPYQGNPYVIDVTNSFGRVSQSPNVIDAPGRRITGTGLTLKTSQPIGFPPPRYWNGNNVTGTRNQVNGNVPVKALLSPEKTSSEGVGTCCSDEEMSIGNDSMDSGNFTGGESSRSDSSPSSSSETSTPTYASVLNTGGANESKCSDTSSEGIPETPKSHKLEGGKGWLRKKGRRLSEDAVVETTPRSKECVFCKKNGETPSLFRSHVLKDDKGQIVCQVLQKYVCPLCGATGANAHTVKYCPHNLNPPAVSMMATLKSMRSATGHARIITNSQRNRSTSKHIYN